MNIARSSLRVFFANTVSSAVVFLGIAFFARELGSHQMGVFFLFQAVLGLIAIPADLGIGSGVTKRLSEGESPGSILSTAIILKGILISPFVLGIVLLQKPINNYIGGEVALYLALALVLQEAAKLTIQTLKGELRVGETAGPTLARKVVHVGVGTILILLGFDFRGIIFGLLAGLFVMLLWGVYRSSLGLGIPSLSHARSLFDYSKYAFIASIGGYFYSWMDIAIIGFFLTQSDVGVYEIAWRVTSISILLSGAISTTIFPQVSKWDAVDARGKIEELIPTVLTPSLVLVIPAFFGTLLFSQEILRYVFGAEYVSAWLVLILLMGDKVFQAVQVIIGRSLLAIDKPNLAARATVASITLNAVLNVVLVIEFGIVGAAFATVISSLTNDGLHLFYLQKFVQIRFPRQEIMESIGASLGMVGILYLLTSIYHVNSLFGLILVIILGAVVYTVFVLLSPTLGARIQETINGIYQAN